MFHRLKMWWYKRHGLKIGENCYIADDVIFDSSHVWHISVGDNVTISSGVRILAHDASTKRHLGYTKIGKVSIGHNIFIGAGTTILLGISIGDNSIVGASSVVTKNVPPNTVVAGNPAMIISTLDEFLAKRSLEMEKLPKFGEDYIIHKSTASTRKEMNDRMIDGAGYIV